MTEFRRKWVPDTPEQYSEFLREMQASRSSVEKRKERQRLSPEERVLVLRKTDGRCHICGGAIEGNWDADHVIPHSAGGEHSVDNYLPSHSVCNNYRWFYSPAEFQEVMRLGVWLRTQVTNKSDVGMKAAQKFLSHEKSRLKRRKSDA
jgi:5-methylcytosine-specific restriction endonuclease McrA